ncbi:hypothetical protein D4R99_01350 [bacterium]|nr:MAG: hypothetical protein D4R99_01350 [bacterium]
MTKKQLYIIIGVIVIIALGFLLASFLISRQNIGTATEKPNTFANFFPFGQNTPNQTTPTNQNQTVTTNVVNVTEGEKFFPILRQITEKPTAGLFSYNKSGNTYVEYTEKETGNIYEVKMEDMSATRLSNSLITRVHEAIFGNDGKSVIMRYVKTNSDSITSFVLDLSRINRGVEATTTTPTLPTGKFLASEILDMKTSSDAKKIFYITKSGDFNNRTAVGSIFDFQKNTSSDVFLSQFSEWLPVSFDGSAALLQTKASQKVPGYLYSFTIKTGNMQKIIGDIKGLTTLPSPDNQKILYSASTLGGVTLHLYNRKDSSTKDIPIQTLPEKCVWKKDNISIYCAVPNPLPSGEYPDGWYQGITSFEDNIWKIDATTGKAISIFVPRSLTNSPIDMTSMILSPSEDFLFFINKRDSSLWAFDLLNGESE